ncbi:hypothetical protein GBAR_LOCUS25202 [Geodia barretti]|uniref:Uncharacterized protein n=1 Tax=Geodia barretti TaxID=519541 RepID=A0AA35TC25_GEOBA|nr:hypothetical protein GBAR_LOCUS25202 [Geodia barretti]
MPESLVTTSLFLVGFLFVTGGGGPLFLVGFLFVTGGGGSFFHFSLTESLSWSSGCSDELPQHMTRLPPRRLGGKRLYE